MPGLTGPAAEHPCFSGGAHRRFGRIHLPVAPRCNLQCAYCDRRYDCPNESRPGVTSSLLTPKDAVQRTALALAREPRIRVAGVAGPGEPLDNPETYETFRLLHRRFPALTLCVSTNGLLLPDRVEALTDCGVRTLTITINAVHPGPAAALYSSVRWRGTILPPEEGVPLLLSRQREGLERAVQAGFTVKVNTVLVPGVNQDEIPSIAALAGAAGAALMNITPLIPCGLLAGRAPPTPAPLHHARRLAGAHLPQFTHCRQCRADACGVPGLEAKEAPSGSHPVLNRSRTL